MKNQIFVFILVAAFMMIFTSSCASTGKSVQSISDIEGKEWKLAQVYINGADIQFRRDNQPEMFRDIYTIKFDGRTVSGTGAPNIYSAPYTSGENNAISIMIMRTTLMASIFEPNNLSEHEFFTFLHSAYSWELTNNNLILNARTQDGREVRLVFAL